ncbi:MAG: hypothetical protein KIT87_03925, partial [Anaerolineae bacterium]|nr:hypothetical protein [Anaerolineae bacterium]
VTRQSSRRSWRIGQRHPVEVHFLVYANTLQAEALALVAKKMKASLMVEGILGDDGLAALSDDGDDLFMQLAQRMSHAAEATPDTLKQLFAATHSAEQASRVTIGDVLPAEPEPAPVLQVLPAPPVEATPPAPQEPTVLDFNEWLKRHGLAANPTKSRPNASRSTPPPAQLALF